VQSVKSARIEAGAPVAVQKIDIPFQRGAAAAAGRLFLCFIGRK
jgi:hypothetical protein